RDPKDGGSRTERLLDRKRAAGVDAANDRRRVVGARAVGDDSSDEESPACGDPTIDLVREFVAQIRSRHRPEVDVLSGWAHGQVRVLHCERFLECLGYCMDDDEPLGGDTALARVREARLDAHLRRRADVRIREHDERITAAQLEDGWFQYTRASLG